LSNIRLFVTILIVVQSAFFVADGWTAYVDRRGSRRQAFRLSVFVFLVAALYFAVQLALSSLVPDFHRLLNGLAGLLGISRAPSATAPSAPTMIVLFVAAYVAGTLFGVTGQPALTDAFERLALPVVLVFTFIACTIHSSFPQRFDAVETVFRLIGRPCLWLTRVNLTKP